MSSLFESSYGRMAVKVDAVDTCHAHATLSMLHAPCACPCSMCMPIFHVHAHAPCSCPCSMFMFMLHVHAHAPCSCPCSILMYMSMLHAPCTCPCSMFPVPCPCPMLHAPCSMTIPMQMHMYPNATCTHSRAPGICASGYLHVPLSRALGIATRPYTCSHAHLHRMRQLSSSRSLQRCLPT